MKKIVLSVIVALIAITANAAGVCRWNIWSRF